MIHLMPHRNPCRLYIHLAFTYSVGPSSVVWSELGPAPPFPPMRMLEVYWSWALSLMCEVALKTCFKWLTKFLMRDKGFSRPHISHLLSTPYLAYFVASSSTLHNIIFPCGSVPWKMSIIFDGVLNKARYSCTIHTFRQWHSKTWVELYTRHY
jgi:hypothetical protein